jgi:hypothetical protein
MPAYSDGHAQLLMLHHAEFPVRVWLYATPTAAHTFDCCTTYARISLFSYTRGARAAAQSHNSCKTRAELDKTAQTLLTLNARPFTYRGEGINLLRPTINSTKRRQRNTQDGASFNFVYALDGYQENTCARVYQEVPSY